jgi:ankyrin repeat protein
VEEIAPIVHLLVERGAELDARANDGRTALMIAVESSCYGAAEALLAHRPDLSARDEAGRTAIDMARVGGWPEMLVLLRRHM